MNNTSHSIKTVNGTSPHSSTTDTQPAKPPVKPIESDVLIDQSVEEATVGAVLLGGGEAFERCDNVLAGDAENFGTLRLRYIWQTFQRLHQRKQAIDVMTVHSDLEARKLADDVGGMGELFRLSNNVPTDIYGEVYAGIVKNVATRRKLLIARDKLGPLAHDTVRPVEDVIRDAESLILDISARHIERRGRWIGEALKDEAEEIKRLMQKDNDGLLGIPTNLRDYDDLVLGYEQDRLYVLAGRPAMGKTALMLCNVLEAAKLGHPVIFHTCEMSEAQCVRRLIAIDSGIPTTLQRMPKQMDETQTMLWRQSYKRLKDLPIFIEDEPRPTPRAVLAKSQWLVRQGGVKAIYIDGIYKMQSDEKAKDNHERYGSIAEGLKNMARKLQVPVIATHQLNRGVEKQQDKRPSMADLRESGRIEEEADVVTLVYRDEYYNEATEFPNQADLIVAKNRDGQVGTVATYFEKRITRFQNANITKVDLSDL